MEQKTLLQDLRNGEDTTLSTTQETLKYPKSQDSSTPKGVLQQKGFANLGRKLLRMKLKGEKRTPLKTIKTFGETTRP